MDPRRSGLVAVVAISSLFVTSASAAFAADVKVDGRITLQGKPVIGKFSFHLDDQFVGAKVNDEGKYKVNRVMIGKYKVTIEGKGIPAKYISEEVTPLTVEVKEGNNTFDFELP